MPAGCSPAFFSQCLKQSCHIHLVRPNWNYVEEIPKFQHVSHASHMNKTSLVVTGILFSVFWASASVAGKFGLRSVEPLLLFNTRFLFAGLVLLGYNFIIQRSALPTKQDWIHLTVFGALNTTLYLGIFVIALQWITPGITTLAVALNPLLISIFSAMWLKRKVTFLEWTSLLLGFGGLIIASYPILNLSGSSVTGLILLIFSMIAYSIGSVYYASIKWKLSRLTINAWQVFIGGVLLIPFTLFFHTDENQLDNVFWFSLLWLVFPVSILAVQLWLRLLKNDAVKASLWLYLCPIFGFIYSRWLFEEPITVHTIIGTVLVLLALYLGQRSTAK
jgi:probable blue pigment (indigoidine) exporter